MKKHKGKLSDPVLNTIKRDKIIQVFLNLEKRQSSNDTIHKLQLSDNKITQDPHKILLEQRLFYKGIYTKTQHWYRSMNLTEREDIPALLITIDFEKVFDCLNGSSWDIVCWNSIFQNIFSDEWIYFTRILIVVWQIMDM